MTTRVGSGFDAHRFSDDPDRALVLGGVTIPDSQGLAGHSDADAVAHACADALLGAAALGDIGEMFPDSDGRFKDADSVALLAEVVDRIENAGWSVVNVDCTVVAQRPRIAPYRDAMQLRLSDTVGAPVTVKASTTEGMGSLGRGEGVACWAVALIEGGGEST